MNMAREQDTTLATGVVERRGEEFVVLGLVLGMLLLDGLEDLIDLRFWFLF